MPLVPARFSPPPPPDVNGFFPPAASVRKSPAALRITPSWLVSSRIDRESANRSAVTENRRSDAGSNSRFRRGTDAGLQTALPGVDQGRRRGRQRLAREKTLPCAHRGPVGMTGVRAP